MTFDPIETSPAVDFRPPNQDFVSVPKPISSTPKARLPGGIQAVIFDKDGTLFDFQATWGAWCSGMIEVEARGDPALERQLAEALGYDPASRRFRPDSVIAEPTEILADRLLPLLPGVMKARLVARMNQRAAGAAQIEAAPLRTLLTSLVTGGLRLGLATNDVGSSTHAHLHAAGIADLFGFVACLDGGWGAKPEPGQLMAVAQALHVEPAHCVMVGDSLHDLHAAKAAGMRAVAVLTGLASQKTLEPAADAVLGSIGELPAWIAVQAS